MLIKHPDGHIPGKEDLPIHLLFWNIMDAILRKTMISGLGGINLEAYEAYCN